MQRDLSFRLYSAERLSAIADVVAEEEERVEGDPEVGDEFEFAVGDCPVGISFPLFESSSLSVSEQALISRKEPEPEPELELESGAEVSFRDLFINDRNHIQSDSSSEEDELERLQPETYCDLPPPQPLVSASLKSGSSRSASLRWKLKNFLHRSNSDGSWKSTIAYLATVKFREQIMHKSSRADRARTTVARAASAPEELYARNRLMKAEEKKKSFLPYKQNLLGLFSFSTSLR